MQTGDSGNGDFEGDRQAASLPTEESTVAGETRKKSRLKRAIGTYETGESLLHKLFCCSCVVF